MKLGRYLIQNFTAADGYAVTAPDEVRVAEVAPSGLYVRVVWDVTGRDQSWEHASALTASVLEYIDEPDRSLDLAYPSLTTHQVETMQPGMASFSHVRPVVTSLPSRSR